MDHWLVRGIEKALCWDGPEHLGTRLARGRLPVGEEPELGVGLLSPTRLLEMLAYRSLTRPQVRCLQQGAELHPRAYLSSYTTRRAQVVEQVHTERLGKLLAEGATLVVDGLNHLDPTLETACRALQWWSGLLVQANAYLTTGAAAGFDLHFDDHDVLVVQVAGQKRWEVRGPTRVTPLHRDVEANLTPSEHVLWAGALAAGQVLAIPRGYWHQATRAGYDAAGYSLHITFGLAPRTGIDWLHYLADLAREQELFRGDLSAQTDHAGDHRALAEAVAGLAHAHSPAEYLAHQAAARPPTRRLVTAGAFGPPTAVVCVTELPPRIDTSGHAVIVTAAGRKLTFARKALPALKILLSGHPAELTEVSELTGVDAGALAQVLLEERMCAEMTEAMTHAWSSGYTGLG